MHRSQALRSFRTTHRFQLCRTTPTRTRFFSSGVSGRRACVGHTREHSRQSTGQDAWVKSMRGWRRPDHPYSIAAGRRICVGHRATHRWQAVHRAENRTRSPAPGGITGRGASALGAPAAAPDPAAGGAAWLSRASTPIAPRKRRNRRRVDAHMRSVLMVRLPGWMPGSTGCPFPGRRTSGPTPESSCIPACMHRGN